MTSVRRSLAFAALLLTALSASAERYVSTVADLKRLFRPGQRDYARFALTGTVTHVSALAGETNVHSFVLRDETAAVQFVRQSIPAPVVGSTAVVRGGTYVNLSGEPWTAERVTVTPIGFAAPPAPLRARLSELDAPEMDLRNVVVTAAVIDVVPDDMGPEYDFVMLKDAETVVPVLCRHDKRLHGLIDSRVCVTGLVQHTLSSFRKFTSPFVFVDKPTDIVQVVPPPADPFAFPPLPLDLYVSPRRVATLGKHSVTGTVLAAWRPNNVLIQTDLDRVARLTLCDGEPLPEPGVPCTAVGYPASDTFHVNLRQSRVRVDGTRAAGDEAGEKTTPERILLNRRGAHAVRPYYHGRLITLTGVVQSVPVSDADRRLLLLNCGQFAVPVDFSACPEAGRDVPLGSTVAATGRCVIEIGSWQPDDVLPRISGLLLVPRRKGDLRVVQPPPWLTVGKLLVFVSVLLVALLAVFVRNRILKRIGTIRLNDRTRLAVELHDSLSQSLAGVAYQITAAQRDADQASAEKKLATADQMLQSCRAELKNCLFDLRNDTIAEKSLDRAIRRTLEMFDDQADISVRFNVSRAPFDDSTVHAVLTIVRELVSNAVVHGHAWTVRVAGTAEDGRMLFSVRDDGEGFDPETAPGVADGHFGLAGIRDRVKRLGGTFELKPNTPRGTKAVVAIPIG